MLRIQPKPRPDTILQEQATKDPTNLHRGDDLPCKRVVLLLAVPFAVREVVDIMINPELGREIESYIGPGKGAEELLFEVVARGTDGVHKHLYAFESRAEIILIVLSKDHLFMGLVLRQWRRGGMFSSREEDDARECILEGRGEKGRRDVLAQVASSTSNSY